MRRRAFIIGMVGAAAKWPLVAHAQGTRKPVIGVLLHSNPEPALGLLRAALVGLGYRDGETIELDVRVANGSVARLAEMAADLAARKVDVIVAMTTPAALAARAATGSIPIVMSAADPVGSGLIASLARPGGNITGISNAVPEVAGAILGLLREALPAASRIGALVNVSDPFHKRLIEGIETANQSVRLELRVYGVAKPDELEAAFERMSAEKVDAAIVQPTLPRAAAIALALRYKLATGSPIGGYAHQGGLLSYSGKLAEGVGVAAAQVDQILKGANPAAIPVRQPTQFEMVLNLKAATALGITLPPLLLARADEVIE
ncbi:MAG: ABC transporter substrate-binding protein [Hyphomicrobiaceae bacterium]